MLAPKAATVNQATPAPAKGKSWCLSKSDKEALHRNIYACGLGFSSKVSVVRVGFSKSSIFLENPTRMSHRI
ncbi:hypothetical protein MTR67_014144 [Solanum verrucosum]|uniref:Uncharacterized protein n=1 Tax=Solanum verrucosum TaxID=315347 RepID=A0AAF0QBN9_SOLVR|nr:hypothetical protein MTR67_014144 [Solanum verrucosum]